MREVLKTAASLSLSGSLAILVLLVLQPLLRERVSRRPHFTFLIFSALLHLFGFLPPSVLYPSSSFSIRFTRPGSAFPCMAFIVCPTRKPIAFCFPPL